LYQTTAQPVIIKPGFLEVALLRARKEKKETKNKSLPAFFSRTEIEHMTLRLLVRCLPLTNRILLTLKFNQYIWVIDQARSVMILSYFFITCIFMNRDGVEFHKHPKKEPISAILIEQAWSVKEL